MGFGQNFEKYFFGLKTCLKLLETILDLLGIVFSDFYFFKKMSHFFQVLAHRVSPKFTVGFRARLLGDFARDARVKSCFSTGLPRFHLCRSNLWKVSVPFLQNATVSKQSVEPVEKG